MAEVPDSPDNQAACLCGGCPSKVDDGMGFYCARGPSTLVITRGFCACLWCPLWSGYGLARDFYCDGSTTASDAEAVETDVADGGSLAGEESVT